MLCFAKKDLHFPSMKFSLSQLSHLSCLVSSLPVFSMSVSESFQLLQSLATCCSSKNIFIPKAFMTISFFHSAHSFSQLFCFFVNGCLTVKHYYGSCLYLQSYFYPVHLLPPAGNIKLPSNSKISKNMFSNGALLRSIKPFLTCYHHTFILSCFLLCLQL